MVVARLRLRDSIACGEPVCCDLIIGIGKPRSGLSGEGRFPAVIVGIPRSIRDRLQLFL